jgi:CubicO group peptidase (beta-lactamase class C family)
MSKKGGGALRLPPPFSFDIRGRHMKRRISLGIAMGSAGLGFALIGAAPAEQAVDGDEAIYRARFAAIVKSGGIFTDYSPTEKVRGATRPSPLRVAPPQNRTVDTAALDRASAYAAAANSSAFLVWRAGALQRADYRRGVTRESQLVSKSLSKPLGAIAIGRAIALGRITSLDQPVADFIPEWRGTPKSGMSVRHLLDMRSGLLEQIVSTDPDHPINRAYIGTDHGRTLIHDYPLTHPPGTHYGYGNATAELVALVIERATGQRYADFVGREILAPIGAEGGAIWIDRPGGLAHSGCCMTLPAESWLRLAILLMKDGMAGKRRLLPAGYVDAMTRGTPQNPHYGLGVWIAGPYVERRGYTGPGGHGQQVLHSQPYADRDLFLFDGNGNQVVYVSRATRMVIARLGDAPPRSLEWDNSALPNMLIAGILRQPGEAAPAAQPR